MFPPIESHEAQEVEDVWVTQKNYNSYDEHREGAEQLLRKERDAGWMQTYATREALDEACGGVATTSRIGVIAKTQGDRLKLRLIHDLRRSGVNGKVQVQERVVLPRLQDVRDDILELIEQHGGEAWDMMGLDFSDAFKHIKVHKKEQKYLTGKAMNAYFKYRTIMFGVKSGPLVWGRNASLLMRLSAAMMADKPVRIQCFVDDPLTSVAGPLRMRRRYLLLLIVFWVALGYKINWRKGVLGRKATWIGATIAAWQSESGVHGVTFTIGLDRINKLAEMCRQIVSAETTPREDIRRLAGLATWISAMIWACIVVHKSS